MKVSDLHTHSLNSFDAESSVFEMCESALRQGLYAIAVTDHCEAPMISQGEGCEYGCFDRLIPKSLSETAIARKKYDGKLRVLSGIELGEPMHDLHCTRRALDYGSYDFILASVHNLRNMPDFYFLDWTRESVDKILKLYFDELAETAEFTHFDSLAHLTYPLRYIYAKTGKLPSLEPYCDTIDKILKTLAQNDKALEINVSGLYKGLGAALPDKDVISRFYSLGGRYVTLGTDAHRSGDVGRCLKEGLKLAHECGFRHYTIFENRTPRLIEIG